MIQIYCPDCERANDKDAMKCACCGYQLANPISADNDLDAEIERNIGHSPEELNKLSNKALSGFLAQQAAEQAEEAAEQAKQVARCEAEWRAEQAKEIARCEGIRQKEELDLRKAVLDAMHELISGACQCPSTAQFPDDTHRLQRTSETSFHLSSCMDIQNISGAMIRTWYEMGLKDGMLKLIKSEKLVGVWLSERSRYSGPTIIPFIGFGF